MLTITNLSAAVGDHPILKNLDLHVPTGEVHAIMGPNGSGKTSLGRVLAGHPGYTVTSGSVRFRDTDLLALDPEVRSHRGVFLSYQYPVEVPGVANAEFLRLAYNAKQKAAGGAELAAKEFAPLLRAKAVAADVPLEFIDRQLNAGMSGGQKKRNEILQLHVLEPVLAILDETDSGLDIDALKSVAAAIQSYRRADRSIILITHFQRLLEMVRPDKVHVLAEGKIQCSGGPELAEQLERDGYDGIANA